MNELIEERLREPDTRLGIILDGYPRTTNQAEVCSVSCRFTDSARPWYI